eukprot:gene15816-21934_t
MGRIHISPTPFGLPLLLALTYVGSQVSLANALAASGIKTWCSYTESYMDSGRSRMNWTRTGASPCNTGTNPSSTDMHTGCPCQILATAVKVYSAASDPFRVGADPVVFADSINLLCGRDIKSALPGALFRPTGSQFPNSIQVSALVADISDQDKFLACLTATPTSIRVLAFALNMECTDSIRFDATCGPTPPTAFSGAKDVPIPSVYVWLDNGFADVIEAANLSSYLAYGNDSIDCAPANSTSLSVTTYFYPGQEVVQAFGYMTASFVRSYVLVADVACDAAVSVSVPGRSNPIVKTYSCTALEYCCE